MKFLDFLSPELREKALRNFNPEQLEIFDYLTTGHLPEVKDGTSDSAGTVPAQIPEA